ncbi:MAG TPA: LysR substrate-binding domain-containing protein [Burkholderiales bacterium]|nr:LysR substrate-binding domain-containing protein [Burkholderiales bacterium]
MKIDTLGVQAFIAIADHASFSRAAESLHITQTALSRRVQNLEAFLGVKLVERTTRSVALTGTGRDFLPQARRLLTDLASALVEIRESGKALRGDVTIACVPTVGVQYLPDIVRQYAALHPANRLRILDHSSSGVAAAVLRREAEFGINMQGAAHPELTSVPLLKDRLVLVCRHDHPLARKKSLGWKALEPYPVILPGHESGNRPHLDMVLERHKVTLQAFYEVQRSSTAVGMVAKGVGVAIVPALAVQPDAYPGLRVIALVDPVVSRNIVLLSRNKAHLTPAAQALYDLIRKQA